MSAYMIKKDVVSFLTNMDEDRFSKLISSVERAKGDTNIDVTLLEDLFEKHFKSEAATLISGLESEVTTYYDSEFSEPNEDEFRDWSDAQLTVEEDEDWYDGDNVQF